MAGLSFEDAEKARDAITASQKKEIEGLYKQWAKELGERASYYSHKSAPSYSVAERQMKELMKQMEATSQQVANEVYSGVKKNIYLVADSVVQQNNEWLKSLGFEGGTIDAAFNYVPDEIVRNIITGQIYDSGWSLSKRIWSDSEETMKQAYQMVAGGMAQNKSMYEIAKDLEKYVQPGAKKPWNLVDKDGRKIYPKQVDYNAQRLGRTLVQHGYQQSFIETTQKNPFITDYIWRSNGSRVCDLCMSRDGMHFAKDDLPMDHPNGMCTIEPNVSENMIDDLADWFNSPDGTYPEIDEFAKNFGYIPTGIKDGAQFVAKYGSSKGKTFNYWYTKLDDEAKEVAMKLKESSGLTWQKWYEQNVYAGTEKITDTTKGVAKSTKAIGSKMPSSTDELLDIIKSQIEDDMLEMEELAFNKLTEVQMSAITDYTDYTYETINDYLRRVGAGTPKANAMVESGITSEQIRSIQHIEEALAKTPLDKDVVLRRGTDLGDLAGFMDGDFTSNKDLLDGMNIGELATKFEGKVGTYHGFTSTSSIYDKGFDGEVEVVLYAPKGTQGSSIMNVSEYGIDEGETLLTAGTKVLIHKVEESGGHMGSLIQVFMEIIN